MFVNTTCTLLRKVTGRRPCPEGQAAAQRACLSGARGSMPTWTPLPENFRRHGYLTLGVGKYFHDVNKALGFGDDPRYPAGTGLPPEADPVSWSNVSVQFPNLTAVEEKWGARSNLMKGCPYTGGAGFGYVANMDGCYGREKAQYCNPDTPADGSGATPAYCDYVHYNDAIEKLRYAKRDREENHRGFFLAVGIRRPHLTWRVPKVYADMYPANATALPAQRLLDKSIDPIAWIQMAGLGGESPYEYTNTDDDVRTYRARYYAAVSWADTAAGKVLAELDALGLADSTMVVMHSDHGWHLGEYNMWEKRTLWENAARVPLVVRVPWEPASAGRRSGALVELVDVYRTVCDVMGVPLPAGDTHPVEGTSIAPLLRDPAAAWGKDAALSTYPRCPKSGRPAWEDNDCIHSVERSDFPFMGYSMRVDLPGGGMYRYTEWQPWNGSTLRPEWGTPRAVELYNHTGALPAGVAEFDAWEKANAAPTAPAALLQQLSAKLRREFGF